MTTPSYQAFNKKLAITISVVGIVLFVFLILTLWLSPDWLFDTLDNANIRVFLSGLFALVLVVVGILLYTVVHTPPVRRFVYLGSLGLLSYNWVSVAFSAISLPRLEQLTTSRDAGVVAKFSWAESVAATWPNLLICTLGTLLAFLVYTLVGVLEKQYGEL